MSEDKKLSDMTDEEIKDLIKKATTELSNIKFTGKPFILIPDNEESD